MRKFIVRRFEMISISANLIIYIVKLIIKVQPKSSDEL